LGVIGEKHVAKQIAVLSQNSDDYSTMHMHYIILNTLMVSL